MTSPRWPSPTEAEQRRYNVALAASRDAGNRSMRAAGRERWTENGLQRRMRRA